MKNKTLSELNDIIIGLKTKHYILREKLTLEERKRYWKAKAYFRKKLQELPEPIVVNSNYGIDITDVM